MALIKITPETLESQAKQLRSYKEQHESTYGQIKNLVNNLVNDWQGEAQSAFQNSFTQKDTVFKQFAQEMENFAQFMDNAANVMRQTEEGLKARAQQLG